MCNTMVSPLPHNIVSLFLFLQFLYRLSLLQNIFSTKNHQQIISPLSLNLLPLKSLINSSTSIPLHELLPFITFMQSEQYLLPSNSTVLLLASRHNSHDTSLLLISLLLVLCRLIRTHQSDA